MINFFLIYTSSGDASNLYLHPGAARENIEALRQQRGLEQSLWEQWQMWATRFLRGDLGYLWAQHRPVAKILRETIPATLQLASLALLLNFILGCAWGILAGISAGHWSGRMLNYFSLIIYSLPTFVLALILILLFSVKLQWLPASQMNSFFATEMNWLDRVADRLQHLILPAAVLGLTGAAAISRYVRGRMREILQQDYNRLAHAKGLSKNRILFHHALKNALLPVITLLGLCFPFLLSGAFIVEVIFAWPGMDRLAYEAFFAKDYPVLLAANLIVAAMVIAGNLLADLLYQFVDPRIGT